MPNYRLDGLFTLKSPLSHIGETISNSSYLVEERILQDDGTVAPVFVYSGNAWRGQLRDLCAGYMLDNLGIKLPLDSFHLLFSGGRIGGAQSVDIEQARMMRRVVPMLALFGGGVGNQILQGKMRVGNCYPLCREAAPVLPAVHAEAAGNVPYASCTFEKEHSRRDDAKIESVRRHLAPPLQTLLGDGPAAGKAKKKEKDGPADQMRIAMELVCPGVRLHTWAVLDDVSDVELGCFVSGLHAFSRSPMIGGKGAIGYGLVDLSYSLIDLDSGETRDFISVHDGLSLLSEEAKAAKGAYDQHLRDVYDRAISDKSGEIAGLLGAA